MKKGKVSPTKPPINYKQESEDEETSLEDIFE